MFQGRAVKLRGCNSFYSLVGGQLTIERVTIHHPKKVNVPAELPGTGHFDCFPDFEGLDGACAHLLVEFGIIINTS